MYLGYTGICPTRLIWYLGASENWGSSTNQWHFYSGKPRLTMGFLAYIGIYFFRQPPGFVEADVFALFSKCYILMTGESRGDTFTFWVLRARLHIRTRSLSWKSNTAATLCYSFDRFFRIPCCRFHGGNSFGSATFTFDRGDLQLLVMKGQAGQTVHGPWLSCWVGVGKWSAVTSKISTGWDHLVVSYPQKGVSPNRLPCSLASSYLQENPRWCPELDDGKKKPESGAPNLGYKIVASISQINTFFGWIFVATEFFIGSFGLSLLRYPQIPWIIHVQNCSYIFQIKKHTFFF